MKVFLISHSATLGLFLTDTSGKTLYYFMKDTSGQSACTGTCITTWPPFSADTVTAPSVLNVGDFSSVSRADGMKQTAFMGRPLYYYSGDTKPGDTNGHGFNKLWYVANTTGSVPVVTTIPTTVPTTTRTPSLANGRRWWRWILIVSSPFFITIFLKQDSDQKLMYKTSLHCSFIATREILFVSKRICFK